MTQGPSAIGPGPEMVVLKILAVSCELAVPSEWAGNPYWRGRISTIELLILTSSNQLLFVLKLCIYNLFYETSYLNKEVNCTEPFPLVEDFPGVSSVVKQLFTKDRHVSWQMESLVFKILFLRHWRRGNISYFLSLCRALTLNIGLGWKGFPGTNALAYFVSSSVAKGQLSTYLFKKVFVLNFCF